MAIPHRIRNQRSKAAPALASTGGLLHLVHLGDTSIGVIARTLRAPGRFGSGQWLRSCRWSFRQ